MQCTAQTSMLFIKETIHISGNKSLAIVEMETMSRGSFIYGALYSKNLTGNFLEGPLFTPGVIWNSFPLNVKKVLCLLM